MATKKSKYKSVMFTKAELKAAWLACAYYTTKTNKPKDVKAQIRAKHLMETALLELML